MRSFSEARAAKRYRLPLGQNFPDSQASRPQHSPNPIPISTMKRNKHTQPTRGRDVIHDFFHAELDALLLVHEVAHVPAKGEPFSQVELHAEATRAGQTFVVGLHRGTPAERQVKVVETD